MYKFALFLTSFINHVILLTGDINRHAKTVLIRQKGEDKNVHKLFFTDSSKQ